MVNYLATLVLFSAKQVNGKYVSKDEIFKESDVIFLGVPLTNLTKNMVNMERFMTMKNTSILINTARGGLLLSLLRNHFMFHA